MFDSIPQEKIDFFRENGFVQFDDVITKEELSDLREYLGHVMGAEGVKSIQSLPQNSAYAKVLNQRFNTWADSPGMATFAFHQRFAKMALELSGHDHIRFFHDHGLWKMPGDSKPTAWHQDSPYWPYKEEGGLSIWIALDDVDENNGCMMFLPGSHKLGRMKMTDLLQPEDINSYVMGTKLENTKPIIVRMKAGSCTFHFGSTYHFANSNHTDQPRRAYAINYMPGLVTYNGKSHFSVDSIGLKAGELITGHLFPIIARE